MAKRDGLFAYNEVIYQAYLNRYQHSLLCYYAVAYNWTKNEASWHSQETICRTLDMSPAVYQQAKEDLERLGWISTEKRFRKGGDKVSVYVTVHCGRDDEKRAAQIAKLRHSKIAREAKAAKGTEAEIVDPETFVGGRNPEEARKFQASIDRFNEIYPNLAKKPKFKKLAFPSVSQAAKFRDQAKTLDK